MAQRFAIDGNFTQSFVGTVKLNASACGTSQDNLASLYYDLDNGSVCYTTSSQDFCYEYTFDTETIYNYGGKTGINCYAKTGHFQFGASATPIGRNTSPVTGVSFTKLLFFNSESIAGTNLYGYLTQNTNSGSITLSTTTQEVVFNYTSQYTFDDQIILGSDYLIDFDNNDSTLTNLVATSNYPFVNNERVCVAVSSQGGGGTATTYQTGSDTTLTSLNNLKILDYDSNVYVTSDPITGQLTLQFGQPAFPTITGATLANFDTNRFSGPDPADSSTYVIDSSYNVRIQYTLDPTNTYLSCSLLGNYEGDFETLAVLTQGDGDETFTVGSGLGSPYFNYFKSGSHQFKVALHVLLEDNSPYTATSNTISATLSKGNPSQVTFNLTYDTLNSNAYVSNTGDNDTAVSIELGATGSIDYNAVYGTSDNGWTRSSLLPDPSTPSTITLTQTGNPGTVNVYSNYTSNGLGTPSTKQMSDSKTFSRITSLRYGALPAGTFTSDLSPTNSELLDLIEWTNAGGTILFGTNTSGEINGYEFDITWSGNAYHYIIMDDNITLSQINVDGFGSISAFTTGTTSNYRFYVTTGIQAGGTGTTAAYKLII